MFNMLFVVIIAPAFDAIPAEVKKSVSSDLIDSIDTVSNVGIAFGDIVHLNLMSSP